MSRRGYKEQEIEEAFKKFDLDGNKILDSEEQAEMLKALEEEKVSIWFQAVEQFPATFGALFIIGSCLLLAGQKS